MLEIELKSVVDDMDRRCRALEAAGATLVFAGRLEDRRYDSDERRLVDRDHVLRLRVYRDAAGIARAQLDWKGPTRYDGGYKVREEVGLPITDPDTLACLLSELGFEVTTAIDREIRQYELGGAVIRFERYPRLDVLVEVEGTPAAIERAIAATGLPRDGFTSDRLADFARRFELRTGQPAILSDAELARRARQDVRRA